VYSSFLFKNSTEYLRDEISVEELVPAFDNSIATLTEFWMFGQMGDTTSLVTKQYQDRLKQKINDTSTSMTLGRVNQITTVEYVSQLKDKDINYSQTRQTKIDLRTPEKKQGHRMRRKQIGMVKGRLDYATQPTPTEVEWYSDLPAMSWDEIQTKYPEKSVPSEIPS
jgi:hypothetical protein